MLNLILAILVRYETTVFFISIAVVAIFLLYDLGVFTKNISHKVSIKEAILKTCLWVSLSVIFCAFLFFKGHILHGIGNQEELLAILSKFGTKISLSGDFAIDVETYRKTLAVNYFTSYLMEYALSIDNIFVIILILKSFNIPQLYHHKILFLGIIGAILFRFILIFLGSMLISKFAWILYIFGLFLIYVGINMFLKRNNKENVNVQDYYIIKLISRYLPIDQLSNTGNFFTKIDGKIYITNACIALIAIEFSDLVFALDSIPAVFAITKDPYIIFFSNVFAILGLRSLFFLLDNIIDKFRFLKTGLAILLIFIGLKMLFADLLEKIGYKNIHSLILIVIILFGSIILSQLFPQKKSKT